MNFECTIHTTVLLAWPGVEIIGSRFHLRQSWYCHVQKLGLQGAYQDKMTDTSRWLQYVLRFPFLDAAKVYGTFSGDLVPIRPSDPKLVEFTSYQISPTIRACRTSSTQRTTNTCESFHSRFNASFYKLHPELFTFGEKLKQFQVDMFVQIQGLNVQLTVRNTYAKNKEHVEKTL